MQREQHDCQRELAHIINQPQGIRFMRRLLQFTGVWAASYVGNDTHATAFNEGRRSVGLYILQLVRAQSPEVIEALLGWSEARQVLPKDKGQNE